MGSRVMECFKGVIVNLFWLYEWMLEILMLKCKLIGWVFVILIDFDLYGLFMYYLVGIGC